MITETQNYTYVISKLEEKLHDLHLKENKHLKYFRDVKIAIITERFDSNNILKIKCDNVIYKVLTSDMKYKWKIANPRGKFWNTYLKDYIRSMKTYLNNSNK